MERRRARVATITRVCIGGPQRRGGKAPNARVAFASDGNIFVRLLKKTFKYKRAGMGRPTAHAVRTRAASLVSPIYLIPGVYKVKVKVWHLRGLFAKRAGFLVSSSSSKIKNSKVRAARAQECGERHSRCAVQLGAAGSCIGVLLRACHTRSLRARARAWM